MSDYRRQGRDRKRVLRQHRMLLDPPLVAPILHPSQTKMREQRSAFLAARRARRAARSS